MKFLRILLYVFFAICAVNPLGAIDTENTLCIDRFPDSEQDRSLQQIKLSSGQFSLSFIHSVSKTTVFDDYIMENNRIVQIKERFSSHGAGLPSMADDYNDNDWQLLDGIFHLKMNREIKRLIVRVNPEYNNTLVAGDETFDLTHWGRRAIEIRICKTPRLNNSELTS